MCPLGVDVGTAFIVGSRSEGGKNVLRTVRNCFLALDDLTDDVNWLKENTNSSIVEIEDEDGDVKSFVIGNDAMSLPNAKVRRPMSSGIINPSEEEASIIISKIIEMVSGPAQYPGEIACGSIPATTISGVDSVNHKRIIEKAFKDLGYDFIPINEGLAIIYANNPIIIDDDGKQIPFSGIGISMGGGQVNVAHSHMGIPTPELAFSVGRSGDWIDERVSETFGRDAVGNLVVSPSEVARFKEKYLNLTKSDTDYTNEELDALGFKKASRRTKFRKMHFGLSSYYEDLINFVLANFVEKFKQSRIQSDYEIEIVISGGTSMPPGVVEKFEKILSERGDFPFEVKCVRRAADPFNSTALGALTKAISEEKKRGIVPSTKKSKEPKEPLDAQAE